MEENQTAAKPCDQLIDYRLTKIEESLSELKKLLTEHALHEQRIKGLEARIEKMETSQNKKRDLWLTPLVSAIVSGIIAFIFVKVGMR